MYLGAMTIRINQAVFTQNCSMYRAVTSRGAGGALAPPVFGQTVNPISTRGADCTHHSTTSPPGFSDLATGLLFSTKFLFF